MLKVYGKHLKLNQYIEVLNGKTVEGVSKESSDLIKRDLQELIEYGKSDEELKAEDKGDIITLKQYLSTREKTNGGLAPIFAIEDGVVINTVDRITKGSPKYAEGGGLIVVIQHDSSPDGSFLVSQYMHMQWTTSKAQRGKKIKRGEIIGFMGSTGESTGSHLHFGIKSTIPGEFSNKSVSPYPMLMSSLSNATDQTEENPPTEEEEEEVLSAEEAGVEFAKGYSAPNF